MSLQVLEETIQKCLQFCDKKEVSSVAFPALGAGNLGFPSDVVARVMITAVQKYYQVNGSGIKVVKFVIFMDSTYQEFQSFLSQNPVPTYSPLTASPGPQPVPSPQRAHTPIVNPVYQPPPTSYQPPPTSYRSSSTSFTSSQSGDMSEVFKTGSITLEVACGDITDDDSDIIVNTTLHELQLQSGAVSKAISQKAGPSMQQDCNMYIKQYRRLEEGKVFITQAAGRLKCKNVFHVVAPSNKKATSLNLTVTTCLKEAECNKVQSIAFPAIGTGGLSYSPKNAAQGMCEAIIEFALTQPSYLQQVKIVVYQRDMHQIFVQKFIDISTGQSGQSQPSLLVRCAKYVMNSVENYLYGGKNANKSNTSKSDMYSHSIPNRPVAYIPMLPFTTEPTSAVISRSASFTQSSSVQIRVYAKSEDDVSKTEDHLLQIINQNCESLPVDDPRIAILRPEQISRLTQKAGDNHVSIEVETELSRIQVRGGRNNVQIVKAEIERILHEIDTEKLQTEAKATAASLMQKKVKWQYLTDDNQYEDYDPEVNYQIEEAYQLYKKQKHNSTFTFKDGGAQYEIIFDSNPMQEKDLSSGELIEIQRSDLEDMLKKGLI